MLEFFRLLVATVSVVAVARPVVGRAVVMLIMMLVRVFGVKRVDGELLSVVVT